MPVITVPLPSNYPWNDQVEKINFWSAFRLGIFCKSCHGGSRSLKNTDLSFITLLCSISLYPATDLSLAQTMQLNKTFHEKPNSFSDGQTALSSGQGHSLWGEGTLWNMWMRQAQVRRKVLAESAGGLQQYIGTTLKLEDCPSQPGLGKEDKNALFLTQHKGSNSRTPPRYTWKMLWTEYPTSTSEMAGNPKDHSRVSLWAHKPNTVDLVAVLRSPPGPPTPFLFKGNCTSFTSSPLHNPNTGNLFPTALQIFS